MPDAPVLHLVRRFGASPARVYAAWTRPRTAIVYTLVLGVVLLSLPSLLPVDLPMGVLQ